MIQRRLFGVLVALACLPAVIACGTSCPEIRDQRRDFDRRGRTTRGPDARLTLPFALLDRVIAGELTRRPPVPLATEKLGIAVPLTLALDRVSTHPAPAGRLGMTLHLGLVDARAGQRLLELELDTSIAPQLGLSPEGQPELELRLGPRDVGALRPRTTPEGVRRLGLWLRENLPSWALGLGGDDVVRVLSQEALELIAADLWPLAKDQLLGPGALVDTRVSLPDLPIRQLALSSSERGLIALITSDLPDAEPLRDSLDRVDRADQRMVLRLSGGTAMGLVNRAMDRGQLPSRFDEHGKPAPDGIWEARVGWRGGSTPLVVHLWRTSGGCRHAQVAARLGLALSGETVRVSVQDGRLTSVAGPAFAEAFAWIETIFGDAMNVTFDTDAFVRFDTGADQVQLRLAKIALGEDDLVLDLTLDRQSMPR